jgi:hypothetical protein
MRYVYSVQVTVPQAFALDFEAWLHPHIQHMLSLGTFCEAQCFARTVDQQTHQWMIRYTYQNPSQWEEYLELHAEGMRSQLPPEFRGQLTFKRWLSQETPL